MNIQTTLEALKTFQSHRKAGRRGSPVYTESFTDELTNNNAIDAYVWSIVLDSGCDEETQKGGWSGVLLGPLALPNSALEPPLREQDISFLAKQAGCILSEDKQGLICVDYFLGAEELLSRWAETLFFDGRL